MLGLRAQRARPCGPEAKKADAPYKGFVLSMTCRALNSRPFSFGILVVRPPLRGLGSPMVLVPQARSTTALGYRVNMDIWRHGDGSPTPRHDYTVSNSGYGLSTMRFLGVFEGRGFVRCTSFESWDSNLEPGGRSHAPNALDQPVLLHST